MVPGPVMLSICWAVGDDWRAQITWNHRSGFKLSVPAQLNQTRVGAFDTFDLFTEYDLKREDLPPLSFTLGVTNVFDTNPPIYRDVATAEVDTTTHEPDHTNRLTSNRLMSNIQNLCPTSA